MRFMASIVAFLICPYFALADESSIKASWFYAYTIGIIIASILITLISAGLVYLIFRCMKKKSSQPSYSFDEISIEKDPPMYSDGIHQIQPILTVSEIVSSIKQSVEHFNQILASKRHEKLFF